jgi:hypothetical protein
VSETEVLLWESMSCFVRSTANKLRHTQHDEEGSPPFKSGWMDGSEKGIGPCRLVLVAW